MAHMIAEEKADFFDKHKIPGNIDDYLFFYVSIGPCVERLMIDKVCDSNVIKKAIIHLLFSYVSDVELDPIDEYFDGIHIDVLRAKHVNGIWSEELFVDR